MIGISTRTFDLDGHRIFQNEVETSRLTNEAGSRRVSRTATLDGGAVLYDTGYSVGDKTIDVTDRNPTQDLIDWAEYIVRYYSTVTVCTRDGAFIGAPQNYSIDSEGVLHITILITQEA